MKHPSLFLFCAAALLTACQPSGETTQTKDQREIAACTRLGFKPGTDAFANCRLERETHAKGVAKDDVELIQQNREAIRSAVGVGAGGSMR